MRKRKRTNELSLELIFKEQTMAINVRGQAPQPSCSGGGAQVTGDLAVCTVITKVGGRSSGRIPEETMPWAERGGNGKRGIRVIMCILVKNAYTQRQ